MILRASSFLGALCFTFGMGVSPSVWAQAEPHTVERVPHQHMLHRPVIAEDADDADDTEAVREIDDAENVDATPSSGSDTDDNVHTDSGEPRYGLRMPSTPGTRDPFYMPPTEDDPWTLQDDQLRASGWQFEDRQFRRGSAAAGLAAMTAGLPFHGVGHLIVGDNEAMFRLLVSEVLSLGVMGVGTLMRTGATRHNGLWAGGAMLQVAGASAFGAGWITDIVGSFKGTTVPLPANSSWMEGMAVDMHYTLLFSGEIDVSSVGVVGFQWRTKRFFIRPEFSFDFDGGYYRANLQGDYAIPLGFGQNTYALLWSELSEEIVSRSHWGREVLLGGVGLRLDVGDLFEHIRGLVWELRLGAGVEAFHHQAQNHRLFLRRNIRVMLPVQTSITMNLNRGVNVEVGYRHRPDDLVGTLTRYGGTLSQQLTVLPVRQLEIAIRLEEGAYFRLWVGLRYYLTNKGS